jgi:hypothetical protein
MCHTAWGVYEFLRDNDLSEQSGTSKRLRVGNLEKLWARLLEELEELKGVVLGTHIHEGFPQDIVLEGYEVFYWAVCYAVLSGIEYGEVEADVALLEGFNAPTLSAEELAALFEQTVSRDSSGIRQALTLVGRACKFANLSPAQLLERDLSEMREKNYLQPYWNSFMKP